MIIPLIQTSTGTWQISYNGENRPIRFENTATQTVVECIYDSLGRRFEKKVTVAGTLTLRERYLYRGYLQIAAFDVTESTGSTQLSHALKHVIFWDPAESTATRPLAINIINDGIYFPTTDLTKNVCELVDAYGNIAATYDYAPFGAVSAGTPSGTTVPANPLQWSSEVYDSELDLVYYNYRHYSPSLSRFLSRDPISEQGGLNLYSAFFNAPNQYFDSRGLNPDFYRMIKLASKASISEITKEIAFSCVKEILGDIYQEATLVAVLKTLCGEAGVSSRGSSHWAKLPIRIDLESELKKSVYDATIGSISSSVIAILSDSKKVKQLKNILDELSMKHLDRKFSKLDEKLLAGAISSEIANELKEELQLETETWMKITKLNRKSCTIRYKTKIDFKLSYAGESFSFSSEGKGAVLESLPAQLRTACGCCKK